MENKSDLVGASNNLLQKWEEDPEKIIILICKRGVRMFKELA